MAVICITVCYHRQNHCFHTIAGSDVGLFGVKLFFFMLVEAPTPFEWINHVCTQTEDYRIYFYVCRIVGAKSCLVLHRLEAWKIIITSTIVEWYEDPPLPLKELTVLSTWTQRWAMCCIYRKTRLLEVLDASPVSECCCSCPHDEMLIPLFIIVTRWFSRSLIWQSIQAFRARLFPEPGKFGPCAQFISVVQPESQE